jgi:hypothetical protein
MQEVVEALDHISTRDPMIHVRSDDLGLPGKRSSEEPKFLHAGKGSWFVASVHPGTVGRIIRTTAHSRREKHVPFEEAVGIVILGRTEERIDDRFGLDDLQRHCV